MGAQRIYDTAHNDHPEWWDFDEHDDRTQLQLDSGDSDVDRADHIMDKIVNTYLGGWTEMQEFDDLTDAIYAHVYAGLT